MIKSMTAFAQQETRGDWGVLTWEIRSLNHRYLDVSTRLPEDLRALEGVIRERAGTRLARGKVECNLRFQRNFNKIIEDEVENNFSYRNAEGVEYHTDFVVLQVGVNVVAIIMARQPRAKGRRIKLPVYPVIPASGAGICFLLLFALPWKVVAIGAGWIAIGAIVYWRVGRARMRSSQLGITVFQDTTRRPDVTSDYPVIVPIAN